MNASSVRLTSGLVRAEEQLRAAGLTGAGAFQALLDALRERLGDDVAAVHPVARAAVSALPIHEPDVDLVGLAYERFFPDLFKGLRGQYFTPPPIVRLLLSRVPLGPSVRVLDPTCGSGGMLVAAARLGASVAGVEVDPAVAELARLNLRLAGAEPDIRRADFFGMEAAEVDVVIANPPFSVPITKPEVLARFRQGRGRTRVLSDHLFLEAIGDWVRPGGHAAIVVPWTIIANRRTASVREHLEAHWIRRAICLLPEGVFRPFGGASSRAALLWLQRRPCHAQEPCLWATLTDPGYDPRRSSLVATSSAEVDALVAGVGWSELGPSAWLPRTTSVGRPLRDLASLRPPSRPSHAVAARLDLADTDRTTGEPLRLEPKPTRGRRALVPGDLLVSRLRPELGNVVIVPDGTGPLAGSPEWIALDVPEHRDWVFHALRTPTWREALPVSGGQTRPRTTPETVLDSKIPFPDATTVAKVCELSRRLQGERRRLRQALDALQTAVDSHAEGNLAAAELGAQVDAIAARIGYAERGEEDVECDG